MVRFSITDFGASPDGKDCAVAIACAMHWWGRGEPVFVSAAPRKEGALGPGKIRNIRIDGLTADCESSFFISGEPGWEIENVYITNTSLRFIP
jgi:hypothetical protein